jgi:acetyltransferase
MQSFDALFKPRSVVLVGASPTPGSLGTVVLDNLRSGGFEGPVHLVNPRYEDIDGTPVYPSVRELPARDVDVAIVVTPAATVPDIIDDCGAAGIPAAIVMSAGFREAGPRGVALERDLVRRARRHGLRFVGPNCLGVIRTSCKFNGTFSEAPALPGRLAVVSQSGALCTAILDWARVRGVGFSSLISTGIGADIDFGEILDFLTRDPETDSILLYVEGVHDARRFMSALRASARAKPVVVMKSGRHAEGSQAAASHTGALVGSDDAFDAALRRAGVLRVQDFADFFATAATLDTGVRTQGRRLAVITNAGGPGVMAADHVVDRALQLAELSPDTLAVLDAALPASWSKSNPVDVLGDAGADRYAAAVRACLADPGVDALVVILTPQALTSPTTVAEELVRAAAGQAKPVFACWMGGDAVMASRALFNEYSIPSHTTPEASVDAFAAVAAYASNQAQLLQVPDPVARREAPDLDGAHQIMEMAAAAGREWLNTAESKAVLAAFRIPIVRSLPAHSAEEAVLIAEEMGLPVAMKILADEITHKTDVGGVRLGLDSVRQVREAYKQMLDGVARLRPDVELSGVLIEPMHVDRHGRELMVGVVRDEVFGPVISFGLGGTLVEVVKDRAVALPPLNRFLVRDLIGRTRASRALGELRGSPAIDERALEDLMLRVSEMVCELPALAEMDLNPVVAGPDGAVAVDARIRVQRVGAAARPYAHMAIHPYPRALFRVVDLADGTPVTVRPIRPEDAVMEREFVNGLSDQSRFLRFMYALAEITPAMLSRFTQIDYDREMALIAVDESGDTEQQVGVARYSTLPDERSCEFAIVIADDWQGRGLARLLMKSLIQVARDSGLQFMTGTTMKENRRMLELAKSLGFDIEPDIDDPELRVMEVAL